MTIEDNGPAHANVPDFFFSNLAQSQNQERLFWSLNQKQVKGLHNMSITSWIFVKFRYLIIRFEYFCPKGKINQNMN